MLKIALIAAGGAVGATLRYVVSGAAQRLGNGSFPVGTVAVNIAGCLVVGFLGALFAGPHLLREEYRVALLVGVLGAFTTFSTFGWETFALVRDGQLGAATANIVLNNGAGLVAVWLGYWMGSRTMGA